MLQIFLSMHGLGSLIPYSTMDLCQFTSHTVSEMIVYYFNCNTYVVIWPYNQLIIP